MTKLRDLFTFLLLLCSVLASFFLAIFLWHNLRLFLFVTFAILLLSFPDLCNFILGSTLICVFAVMRAGGVVSLFKVQLISKNFSCSKCGVISEAPCPIINDAGEIAEESEAARQITSTINVEPEKVTKEVLHNGAMAKVEAAKTDHDLYTGKLGHDTSKPVPYVTAEFKVGMHCEGCMRKIVDTLSRMEGAKRLDISMRRQKVTVSGYVDPVKVISKLKRIGKSVELWSEEADKVRRDREANNRLPQNPAPKQEKLLRHLKPRPDLGCPSDTACIKKHDHPMRGDEKGHIQFDTQDCLIEPLAMNADEQYLDLPKNLGTGKLRYASCLDTGVTRHNPGIQCPALSEYSKYILHQRSPMLPLAGKSDRNEQPIAVLDAGNTESWTEGPPSTPYRRGILQNSSRLDHRVHMYRPYRSGRTISSIVHRSTRETPNPHEKRKVHAYRRDISDTSDDEADQQLYAVMTTKNGYMKLVPVKL